MYDIHMSCWFLFEWLQTQKPFYILLHGTIYKCTIDLFTITIKWVEWRERSIQFQNKCETESEIKTKQFTSNIKYALFRMQIFTVIQHTWHLLPKYCLLHSNWYTQKPMLKQKITEANGATNEMNGWNYR